MMGDVTHKDSGTAKPIIGWREWLALPELKVQRIKAKIDTGARTSALHAFEVTVDDQNMVHFLIHPEQRETRTTIQAQAPLLEYREVRNSGGQAEKRPVILTPVQIGDRTWTLELTLTNRDAMGFRMLLGRQAVKNRFLVDPGKSYLLGCDTKEVE